MTSVLSERQIEFLVMHHTLFYYDESSPSGLRNGATRGPRALVDTPAGSKDHKHWRIRLKGRTVGAHQIVWLLNGGKLNIGYELDHKNRNGFDNRICNLRLVSSSFNRLNRQVQGSVSFRGVCFHRISGLFTAQKTLNGVKHYLGCFKTAEEAARAWDLFCVDNVAEIEKELLNFPEIFRSEIQRGL